MFEKFFEFVGSHPDKRIESPDMFLETVAGNSYFNGMFRFFKIEQKNKWKEIVTEYYSAYSNKIEVICYDWLGRVFALSSLSDSVVLFEPGTGKVYNTDAGIEEFFDSVVVDYTNDCFASDFFNDWYRFSQGYQLKYNECASYIVPLYLNGADSEENLEVCDMEVHWEIMRVAHNLKG